MVRATGRDAQVSVFARTHQEEHAVSAVVVIDVPVDIQIRDECSISIRTVVESGSMLE